MADFTDELSSGCSFFFVLYRIWWLIILFIICFIIGTKMLLKRFTTGTAYLTGAQETRYVQQSNSTPRPITKYEVRYDYHGAQYTEKIELQGNVSNSITIYINEKNPTEIYSVDPSSWAWVVMGMAFLFFIGIISTIAFAYYFPKLFCGINVLGQVVNRL